MRPFLYTPGPALRLCSAMQRSTHRVHLSTSVSESSCIAELIIGLRPDPCSLSAYQLQRCADRTFSTRTASSIVLTSTERSALVIIVFPPRYTNCTTMKPLPRVALRSHKIRSSEVILPQYGKTNHGTIEALDCR